VSAKDARRSRETVKFDEDEEDGEREQATSFPGDRESLVLKSASFLF
jgi:hypothetical protein